MKRQALCVGINSYPGAALSGCVNDALDWGNTLAARGYSIEYLLDKDATLKNIRDAVRELVSKGKYRDRLVFTYSGHGTYRQDADGDEQDRRDEAICPVDCFDVGMLYDDEIGSFLGSRHFGVKLVQISDSCHSGSVSRLIGTRGKPKFIPSAALPDRKKEFRKGLMSKGHVLMAGCEDLEYSYDAWFSTPGGQRANGAFTRFALDALKKDPRNYKEWIQLIREKLPTTDFPQTPQLEASYYRKRWQPLT